MPNSLAYLALLIWPLIALVFFQRMRVSAALIWAIFAGYLFLPQRPVFDAPMLPQMGKEALLVLVALFLCLAFQPRRGGAQEARRRTGWLPEQPLVRLLLLGFVMVPVFTVLTNMDPVQIGAATRPALRVMEIASLLFDQLISVIPFIIAARYIVQNIDYEYVIKVLIILGVTYSILVLFEIIMSPQLNKIMYGFYQFEFRQQKRGDGFRPVVFLRHGLWTAAFMAMAFTAAVFAARHASRERILIFAACAVWLGVILAMSRSLGALFLGVVFCAVAILLSKRMVLLFAALIATVILIYPMGRSVGLVPTSAIVALAERIDAGRAASLQYRFDNEELYLARANDRPLFGWGGWGRGRLYSEETGAQIGASDARWVILFGFYGWVGYLTEFLLLTSPIFTLAFRRSAELHWSHVALAAILALNLTDMLFNATLTPITWLLAGALTAAASTSAIRGGVENSGAIDARRETRVRAVIGSTANSPNFRKLTTRI